MTAQAASQYYTAADVEEGTGVPVPKQNQWIERDTIIPSRHDKRSIGSGDPRLMSVETVYQFAITACAVKFGLSAKHAAYAARKFTDQSQPGRPAGKPFQQDLTVLVLRTTGPVVINPPYHADFCDLADHGTAFVAIDCGKICREVDEAINKHK